MARLQGTEIIMYQNLMLVVFWWERNLKFVLRAPASARGVDGDERRYIFLLVVFLKRMLTIAKLQKYTRWNRYTE